MLCQCGMTRRSKKTEWVREPKDDQLSHWLGEGMLGQDDLFFDLQPHLYAVDALICKQIAQIGYQMENALCEPAAVLVPPKESLSWFVPHLVNYFEVFLWTDSLDEALDELVRHFNVEVFSGQVPERICPVGYVLCLDSKWEGADNFFLSVEEAMSCLAEDGTATFILQVLGREEELKIFWNENCSTPYHQFIQDQANYSAFEMSQSELCSIPQGLALSQNSVSEFLRRHRSYFGKNARELCIRRMNEIDFSNIATDEECWVLVVSYRRTSSN